MAAAPAVIPTPPVGLPLPLETPPTSSAVPPPVQSQPNANSDSPPPASGSPNSSTSPPPSIPSAPPPSVSPSPPAPPANESAPVSQPVVTPPPPSILSPPPVSASPPPGLSPPILAPPPVTISPPPPSLSSPPPGSPPILSPPPSQPPPQPVSTPPASPPPPNVTSSPPTVVSPPPSATPPENSPPSPPSTIPPENSPPPHLLHPAAPAGSPPPLSNSPPNQSLPTPESQPLAPPPPKNSSIPGIPATSPLLSPPLRSGNADPPVRTRNSSNTSPNDSGGSESLPNSTGSGKNRMATALGIGVGSVLVVFFIGLLVWCMVKKRRKRSKFGGYVIPTPLSTSQRSDISYSKPLSSAPLIGNISRGSGYPYSPPEPGALGNSRPMFTYEELLQVTSGFSEHNLLGEGGFGCVYKGCLPDGREVAVKQLNVGGSQGEREFQAEVEIISRIHHRHLVSLVGYCISEHQRLLVYDYVPNDTLYYHLHGEGRPVLDWATRLKIAAGAARGIAYLHEDCHPRIIHRDIKSSNILLDNNFEAQARPLLSHALDNREYDDLIDPKLGTKYVEREMFRVIEGAAACVRHSAAKRPRMGQVVRALDSIYDSADLSNGIRPGESKQYDSAQLSAEIREFRRMAFGTGSQDFSSEFSQTSWRTERE